MMWNPTKVFPCDCMGEGIAVTPLSDKKDISEGDAFVSEQKKLRNCCESPFIQLSFWEYGKCNNPNWFSNWWWRLETAWHVFRDGSAWPDQVVMKASVAKNLANHILYIIGKAQREKKLAEKQEPLVKDESVWPPGLQKDINDLTAKGKELIKGEGEIDDME